MRPALAGSVVVATTLLVGTQGWPAGAAGQAAIQVTALEYRYVGLPTSVPAQTRLTLTNAGAEVHQIVVARRADGVDMTWDRLLAEPDPVRDGLMTLEGQSFAPPGATAATEITLTRPGTYFAVCFIPQGVTSIPAQRDTPDSGAAPDGPAHYLLGMRQEFTVTEAGSTPGPLPTVTPITSGAPPAPGAPPSPGL